MTKDLSYYQSFADSIISEWSEKDNLFDDIEEIAEASFELPSEISEAVTGIRAVKSTDAADAVVAARKAIAGSKVNIEVIPSVPKIGDNGELAENIELALDYHLANTLRRGANNPIWDMADSSVKYGQVAFQVEYLPRKLKKESGPRKKAALRNGDFTFVVHKRGVYADVSSEALERVVLKQAWKLGDVVSRYGEKLCRPLIKKVVGKDGDEAYEMRNANITLYDYTDYEDRVIWAVIGSDGSPTDCDLEILREAHGLPFLNWVFRNIPDPLLKLLSLSGENDNYNILLSLQMYNATALSGAPRIATFTVDGEGLDVDYSNIGGTIDGKSGDRIQQLSPPMSDNSVENEIARRKSNIAQTTQISQSLTALDNFAKGTPFSTINALRETGIAGLSDITGILRRAMEDALYIMLEWIKFDKRSLTAIRTTTIDSLEPTKNAGAGVLVDMSELEPSDLKIFVNLEPDTMTDKQGRMNLAQLAGTVLHLGHRKMWELAGVDGAEQSFKDWQDEQIEIARVMGLAEAEKAKPMMTLQMQMQQAQQAQQMQAQAQQAQFAAAQGVDSRFGGNPPARVNPQATREQVSGMTKGGQEVV